MQSGKTGGKLLILGAVLCLSIPFGAPAFAANAKHAGQTARHSGTAVASARSHRSGHGAKGHAGARELASSRSYRGRHLLHFATYNGGGYLNCVAFAREETGMDISGNAGSWWGHAAGLYERGNRPEAGAIMSFMANGRMPSGHVAVVATVINSRMVEIDHANWSGAGAVRGGVSRNIPVVDVSPNNDWTAVRVGLGQSGEFGSVYPTYGFIYDRADAGRELPAHPTDAALPALNPAPRDLRSRAQREAAVSAVRYDEVAEAPAAPASR